MISSWKRLKAALRAAKKREDIAGLELELTIPSQFRCPISLDLMKDPVTLPTGITYDRENIEKWIEAGNVTCPMTKNVLRNLEPVPNHVIRKIIQDWCEENRAYGVERIPTPRIPITSHEVQEILAEIEVAVQGENYVYCLELVSKLKVSANESDRNRRCVVANGAGRVLSAAFEELSKRDSVQEHASLLEEILAGLISLGLASLDEEIKSNFSKIHSLRAVVWFLRHGSLSGQKNAALALKTALTWNQKRVEMDLISIEGVLDALVKLIKDPICATTTNASIFAIYTLMSSSEPLSDKKPEIMERLLEMGLVEIVLEVLVDSDRSTCEKALGVLDKICSDAGGMKLAGGNALIVPLLAKKLLRVSSLSTEFCVSILWKVVKCDENVVVEALQAGGFQKLLLLLQVGCKESTKEKATELLKAMNVKRNNVDCGGCFELKNWQNPIHEL